MLELIDRTGGKHQGATYEDRSKSNPQNSFDRLRELKMQALVLNGDNNILIPTSRSWELMSRIQDAQLTVYPRAGHGFLYQYAEVVARDVIAFLDGSKVGSVGSKM